MNFMFDISFKRLAEFSMNFILDMILGFHLLGKEMNEENQQQKIE